MPEGRSLEGFQWITGGPNCWMRNPNGNHPELTINTAANIVVVCDSEAPLGSRSNVVAGPFPTLDDAKRAYELLVRVGYE